MARAARLSGSVDEEERELEELMQEQRNDERLVCNTVAATPTHKHALKSNQDLFNFLAVDKPDKT